MDTRTRKFILAAMILALAVMLYITFTGGELLQPKTGNRQQDEWMKPTTGILGSMRGTATAEAERPTPEPEAKLPGMKAQPQPNLDQWWFDIRFPNWVNA